MLDFIVDGQLLRRADEGRILSGSTQFLKFRASFSKEWEDYTKTFVFKGKDGESYLVFDVEDSREYEVPHEVLAVDSQVEVSVFGSSRLTNFATANSVILYVEKCGLLADFKQSAVPTPDLYAQICHKLEQTLRELPEKNLKLKCEEDGVYWKTGEELTWHLLFSLSVIRGKDGALWYTGDKAPEGTLGKDGDFFFWENKGRIFGKNTGEWTLVFDPESFLLPLADEASAAAAQAKDAQDSAAASAKECRSAADRAQSLFAPKELYPEAFTIWNYDGPIGSPTVGEPLFPNVMEPEATYRVAVTPGKSYRFTPTPQGDYYCYFAVGDAEGNCLFYTKESLSEYTVKESYDGKIPTHVYYGVKNIREVNADTLSFCQLGWDQLPGQLEGIAQEVKEQADEASAAARQAKDAQDSAAASAEECRNAADRAQSLFASRELYPAAFTIWNYDGPIGSPTVGEPLSPNVMEPEATYRVAVTPGKSYRFTPTPQGDYYCYFAVGDAEGNCLFYTKESVSEYTVKESYDGKIPTHVYYGVKNIREVNADTLSFCQLSDWECLMQRVAALEGALA